MKKKGFVEGINRAPHHIFLELYNQDRMILFTKVSHSGDIHSRLISAMARQCHLSTKDFKDLARCPLSKERYLEKLGDLGLLGRDADA